MSNSDESGQAGQKPPQKPAEPAEQQPSLDGGSEQLSPVLALGYQRLYEQAYRELCKAVTGEEPADEPPPELSFEQNVQEYLERNREALYQKICEEFDYCAKRKKMTTIIGCIDAIITLAALISDVIGGAGIASATWLLSKHLLDELCECSDS